MYRSIEIEEADTTEMKIYDSIIKIFRTSQNSYRYVRTILENSVSSKLIAYGDLFTYGDKIEKLLENISSIEIFPDNWSNDPRRMYSHLMLRIKNPITMPPNTEGVFITKLLPDVALYMKHHESFNLLDIIPSPQYKLALYGTPDSGIVARYYKVKLDRVDSIYSGQRQDNANSFEISLTIDIKNQSDKWVTISRLVVPLQNLSIYMCRDREPSVEIIKTIIKWSMAIGRAVALVELDNKSPCSPYEKIAPYIDSYEKKSTFIMEEGL